MESELLYKKIYVFAMLSRESLGNKNNNLRDQLDNLIRNFNIDTKYSNIFIPHGVLRKCSCNENDIIQGLNRLSASLPKNNPLKKLMSNFGSSTKLVIPSPPHQPTNNHIVTTGNIVTQSVPANTMHKFSSMKSGIKNCGNTCYANASLQVVLGCIDILSIVNPESKRNQESEGDYQNRVIKANLFNSFLTKYSDENILPLDSENFMPEFLIQFMPDDVDPLQQLDIKDAFRSVIVNLAEINSEINRDVSHAIITTNYYSNKINTPNIELNTLNSKTDTIKSYVIEYSRNKQYTILLLLSFEKTSNIRGKSNSNKPIEFINLWNSNFNKETYKFHEGKPSNNYGGKTRYKSIDTLVVLPKYLPILIERVGSLSRFRSNQTFKYNNKVKNIYMHIAFYINELNKESYESSCKEHTPVYEFTATRKEYILKAFGVQRSKTASGGHYVSYRFINNKWYLFNDTDYREVTLEDTMTELEDASILLYERIDEREMTSDEIEKKMNTIENISGQSPLSPRSLVIIPVTNTSKWTIGDTKHTNILDAVKEYYTKISPNSRPKNGSWNIPNLNGTSALTEKELADLIKKHVFIKGIGSGTITLYSPHRNPPNCTVCNSVFLLRNADGTFSIMMPNNDYKFKNSANINSTKINLNSLLDKK